MNVLGVIFDSKLNWNLQVASCISKAKKKLFALRLRKRFFRPDQMRVLLDSQFYSILYYNSVIWLTTDLNAPMKQNLFSISANALRTCLTRENYDVSFESLHVKCKKCTPKQITLYQSSLKIFKTLNDNLDDLTFKQVIVFDQIRCTTRQLNFEIQRNNTYKIEMNTTSNKLFSLCKMISLGMLHLTFIHFKKLAKIQFLKNGKT